MKNRMRDGMQALLLFALIVALWVYGNANYGDRQVSEKSVAVQEK